MGREQSSGDPFSEHLDRLAQPMPTALLARFHTVSDPQKFALLGMLRQRPMYLSELAPAFAISKPALLRHLQTLCVLGLVQQVPRRNKWQYYQLTHEGARLWGGLNQLMLKVASGDCPAAMGAPRGQAAQDRYNPVNGFSGFMTPEPHAATFHPGEADAMDGDPCLKCPPATGEETP